MIRHRVHLRKFLFKSSILGLILNSLSGFSIPLWANWTYLVHGQEIQVQPPPNAEAPPNGSPGPGRRDCESITSSLVPIVPNYLEQVSKKKKYQRYSLTSQNNPTIWFYIPYKTDLIQLARLRLWQWSGDTERTRVYDSIIETPQGGLVAISLDSTTHKIEPNTWYQATLYVDAYCDNVSPLVENDATAWIKVIESNDNIDNLPFPDQILAYLTNDFWYDAAHLHIQNYCQNNNSESFVEFLTLGNLAEAVILNDTPHCTTANFQSR